MPRSWIACLFAVSCLTAVAGQGSAGAAEPDCPAPDACADYVVAGPRWLPPPYQTTVQIPYWINPAQPWVPESSAVSSIRRAFATWDDVLPTVAFVFEGVTARPPVPDDGINVVGWGAMHATALTLKSQDSWRIWGADTILNVAYPPWVSYDCEQANNSCVDRPVDFPADWHVLPPGTPDLGERPLLAADIQNVVTNAVGHWLGLAGLPDPVRHRRMTMLGQGLARQGWAQREKSTLGLGDILGAREVYPCDCPLPAVYVP